MKRVLTVIFLAAVCPLFAQDFTAIPMRFSHEWSEGHVVFTTGDSLRCKLRFNRSSLDGVVHIMRHEEVISVTTPFIRSFTYFDQERQRFRRFINMTLPAFRADSQQFLVEKLYDDGRFAIINQRTYEMPYQQFELIRFLGRPIPVYKKYILDTQTGQLMPLNRHNALRVLEDHKNEVLSYIDQKDIRFKKVADFIDVFAYHSSL